MIAPGPLREVGRNGQHLSTGQRQRSIELGEAQVVADRQAHGDAIDVGDDQRLARRDPRRLRIDRARRPRRRRTGGSSGTSRRSSRPGAISTLVLWGRASSPDVSARLPTRIQASCRRATSEKASVWGPGTGRAEARKPSSGPRNWRYSGRATRRAPPAAASAASVVAVVMLASTSSVASSWTRATGKRMPAS